MAKGMAIPVRTNRRGGATLRAGSPYARQTIAVGLTPNISRNPFQAGDGVEVGISERFVFALNSPGAQAGARRQIVQFFVRARAGEIARLAAGRDGISFSSEGAEMTARIKNIELEADKERDLVTNLKDGLQSGPKANLGT